MTRKSLGEKSTAFGQPKNIFQICIYLPRPRKKNIENRNNAFLKIFKQIKVLTNFPTSLHSCGQRFPF